MEVWMREGPRVTFVMREALFEIYTWIFCLSYLHEKQTSRIQSLYLYPIKIVPFWLRNIRVFFNTKHPVIILRGHFSSLHRPMSLHGKMDVKNFLIFIVAENTGSVNILINMHAGLSTEYLFWLFQESFAIGMMVDMASKKIFQAVLCPTQLPQWKLICTFNQHCLSY